MKAHGDPAGGIIAFGIFFFVFLPIIIVCSAIDNSTPNYSTGYVSYDPYYYDTYYYVDPYPYYYSTVIYFKEQLGQDASQEKVALEGELDRLSNHGVAGEPQQMNAEQKEKATSNINKIVAYSCTVCGAILLLGGLALFAFLKSGNNNSTDEEVEEEELAAEVEEEKLLNEE